MKTDVESRGCIVAVILAIVVIMTIFIVKKTTTANATTEIPEKVFVSRNQIAWYEETLRAYNHLLHRIWVDKPNYVEDVLVEYDEFIVLDSLMNGHWQDTFEFYDEGDSIQYHENWESGDGLYPDTLPSIPGHVQKRLRTVFEPSMLH